MDKEYGKIGIALSGGGMRGVAHIGVLQAIEERGIKPEFISGASSGALIGTLYAAGYSPAEILEIAEKHSMFDLMKFKISRMGFSSLDGIEEILKEYIPVDSFDALKTPLYVALTDMLHGNIHVLSRGKLFQIVKASCSIPVLFKPELINEIAYSDGGILNNLPSEVLRDKVDTLIGVNLIVNPDLADTGLQSMISVAMRTFELSVYENSSRSLDICDIKIEPHELSRVSIFRHKDVKEIYNIGYNEAVKVLEEADTSYPSFAKAREK